MPMGLSEKSMYRALTERDRSYEGIFIFAVKTTGIFCRPTCRARKPKPENIEFFSSPKEALLRGYRPCKLCQPMAQPGDTPEWIRIVLREVTRRGTYRMTDQEIRGMGVEPNRLRRWFKQNHQMTFQSYLRSIRLGSALGHLVEGKKVIEVALDHGYESLSGFSDAFKKALGSSPSQNADKEIIHVYQVLTPLGPMMAASIQTGICLLEFTDRRGLENELQDICRRLNGTLILSPGPHLESLKTQLGEYFAGTRKTFDLPLVTPGSEFQNRVWNLLRKIPYGQTRSYAEQARVLGNPKAVRAVARANGENRLAILIPCHRVIGADGKLVGYSGGLARKKYLLELERPGCFI